MIGAEGLASPNKFVVEFTKVPSNVLTGKYNPNILTAIPRSGRGPISGRAAEDKKKWVKKHFNVSEDRVYAVSRVDKSQFAKDGRDGRPNLLIDDHVKNIDAFRKAGGLGIVHTSARNTIKELKLLGYK